MAPRWPQDGPRWPQDGPMVGSRWAPKPLKTLGEINIFAVGGHLGPKMAQDGAKMAPRWPQDRPKMAQDGPKTAQDGPKLDPRWPKKAPRRLQVASYRDLIFVFSSASCRIPAQSSSKTLPRPPQFGPSLAKLPASCHLVRHVASKLLQDAS